MLRLGLAQLERTTLDGRPEFNTQSRVEMLRLFEKVRVSVPRGGSR
jgi:hypothetical protein